MNIKKRKLSVDDRRNIERQIMEQVVKTLLAEKLTISVDDGGDDLAIEKATDFEAIMENLHHTDMDTLVVFRDENCIGEITFVYGNDGWDVIQDNDAALEKYLVEATKLADKLEEENT